MNLTSARAEVSPLSCLLCLSSLFPSPHVPWHRARTHPKRVFFLSNMFCLSPGSFAHYLKIFSWAPSSFSITEWRRFLASSVATLLSLLNGHKTHATEPQHPTCRRTPVTMSTAWLSFTHPLRSLHRPDALMVQGHMWLLYQHRSILFYLVSKRYHLETNLVQWSIDFFAAVTGAVISLFQTSLCRASLSRCLRSGWLAWLITLLRRMMGC